jgi:predicted PurR-regulated permease PerM
MDIKLPATVKRSIELLGLCALVFVISVGKEIVMPILMAFFISILLLPIFRLLRKWKFPEAVAIVCSIVIGALMIAGIVGFLSYQVSILVSDFPEIQKNVNAHINNISTWINEKMHFSSTQQVTLLKQQSEKMVSNAGSMLSGAAVSLSSVFVFVGLLPIYVFLIMYYKNLLLRFVFLWFSRDYHEQVELGLKEIESIIKSYLVGLLIQITYITVLLGGALAIFGIKHALLIGIIFGILNLIPYIGALIGNLLGVLLTLTSSQDLSQVFTVLISIAVVQFLDNNILMPRIVGSKVKINALMSIVGVIIGGSVAGISGMFLSLPVMAILKIVFDRTDEFRHWGVLLGDDRPALSPINHPVMRLRNKRLREKQGDDESASPQEENDKP